jgi:hypothetical protein
LTPEQIDTALSISRMTTGGAALRLRLPVSQFKNFARAPHQCASAAGPPRTKEFDFCPLRLELVRQAA